MARHSDHFTVAIIGGGPSGICVGAQLTRQLRQGPGSDYILLEKSNAVGGTWHENNYPGAACDIPSHLYSLSFAPKLDWTEAFSPAAGKQRYTAFSCKRVIRNQPFIDIIF